jgi:hypothetical protein
MWPSVDLRRRVGSGILLLSSAILIISLFVPWGHTTKRGPNHLGFVPGSEVYHSPVSVLFSKFFSPDQFEQANLGNTLSTIVFYGALLLGPPLILATAALIRLRLPGPRRGFEIAIILLCVLLALFSAALAALLNLILGFWVSDNGALGYFDEDGWLVALLGSVCALLAAIIFAWPARRSQTVVDQADVSWVG